MILSFIEVFKEVICYLNLKYADEKEGEQAGAELSQAQFKLCLAKPATVGLPS